MTEAEVTDAERKALTHFFAAVTEHYGDRLHDIVLFGSRSRGDARPDSDADVAVILEDGGWSFWREVRVLGGLAFEPSLEHGLFIQPWPIARSEWETPSRHRNARFVEAIRHDARPIRDAA